MELRWVWHDVKNSSPPTGCIMVGDRLYQKLQYRKHISVSDNSVSGNHPFVKLVWSDWVDVPHCGLVMPNVMVSGLP